MAVAVSAVGTGSSVASASTSLTIFGSFGTAAADRLLFCGINYGDTNAAPPTVTGVTIGGITATKVDGIRPINNTLSDGITTTICDFGVWWAPVPTGTSGNVVMTFSAASSTSGGVALTIVAVTGSDTSSPVVTHSNTTASSTSVSGNAVLPTNGAVIGFAATDGDGLSSWAWTNLTLGLSANIVVNTLNVANISSGLTTANATQGRTAASSGSLNTVNQTGLVLIGLRVPLTGGTPYNPWPQLGPMLAQ